MLGIIASKSVVMARNHEELKSSILGYGADGLSNSEIRQDVFRCNNKSVRAFNVGS